MNKRIISSPHAPSPVGPYSAAIRHGNFLFLSGQIPLDPETGEMITDAIEAQTRRVLENLQAILSAAGGSLQDVVKTTIFLTDLALFARVNAVYASYFPHDPPARSTVQVSALPKGAQVEIECIAILESPES